jgi:hypothetical protein
MKKLIVTSLCILLLTGCSFSVGEAEYQCPSCKQYSGVFYANEDVKQVFFCCTNCGCKSGWFESVTEALKMWPPVSE